MSINRRLQVEQTGSCDCESSCLPDLLRVNLDVIFLAFQANHWTIGPMGLDRLIAPRARQYHHMYDCLYRGSGRAFTKRTTAMPQPENYGKMYDLAYDMLEAAGWQTSYGSANFSAIPGDRHGVYRGSPVGRPALSRTRELRHVAARELLEFQRSKRARICGPDFYARESLRIFLRPTARRIAGHDASTLKLRFH